MISTGILKYMFQMSAIQLKAAFNVVDYACTFLQDDHLNLRNNDSLQCRNRESVALVDAVFEGPQRKKSGRVQFRQVRSLFFCSIVRGMILLYINMLTISLQ